MSGRVHENAGVAQMPERQAQCDVTLVIVERRDAHLRRGARKAAAATSARQTTTSQAAKEVCMWQDNRAEGRSPVHYGSWGPCRQRRAFARGASARQAAPTLVSSRT